MNNISPESLLRLVNLTSLDLSKNQLSKIEGLSQNILLEELALEGNHITQISALSALQRLQFSQLVLISVTSSRRLDASCNRIQDISGIQNLTSIVQLSLEDNLIPTISPLAQLSNLLELCTLFLLLRLIRKDMTNNHISTEREFLYLNSAQNLSIADFSGNPVAELPFYRGHLIFRLPQLKVRKSFINC